MFNLSIGSLQACIIQVTEAGKRVGHYMRDADVGAGMPAFGVVEATPLGSQFSFLQPLDQQWQQNVYVADDAEI